MINEKEVKECFANAWKEEQKGKKHKGLLVTKSNNETAKEFLIKAKTNLILCDLYKQNGFDYKTLRNSNLNFWGTKNLLIF